MERMVFTILSLLLPGSSGMAQVMHGGSGQAQIDHFEYGHHFSQGTTHRSVQVQAFDLPDTTTKTERSWLNQAGTQVRAGEVELYFDDSFHLDHTPSRDEQTSLPIADHGLPSFGWNLEAALIQNKFPEFQQAFAPNEVERRNPPIPQVFDVCIDDGDAPLTTLSPEWQKLVDEGMWKAVRDMPKGIKDALIQEGERQSEKAFVAPTELPWIWYSEMQEIHSSQGTTTKIIGPAGIKLIRITGKKPTEINGIVDAGEEDIYLINQNGIIVGPGSEIK